MATFALKLGMPGRCAVIVNDLDIAEHVSALRLTQTVDDLPRLALELRGEFDLEGEGIVEIHRPHSQANVVEWLDGIDPVWLEEAVLRVADMDTPPGATFLSVLRAKATEEGEGT